MMPLMVPAVRRSPRTTQLPMKFKIVCITDAKESQASSEVDLAVSL